METNNKPNGLAIASLVVSCLAMLSCCIWQIQIFLGMFGLVLGILALRSGNKNYSDLGIAGIVVGAMAVAIGIAIAVMSLLMITSGEPTTPGNVTPDTFENGKEATDSVMMALRSIGCRLQ